MTDTHAIVRIRDVFRIPPLEWHRPPTADEALIDRLKIAIPVTARFPTEGLLQEWLAHLSDNLLDDVRLTGNGNSLRPGVWKIPIVERGWTVGGDIVATVTGTAARLHFNLDLNPTRTLAHLLTQYQPHQFHALRGKDFFIANAALARGGPSLDQRDNMIPARHIPRALRERENIGTAFLDTFEQGLQRLVLDTMMTFPGAPMVNYAGPAIISQERAIEDTPSRRIGGPQTLTVNWGGITLKQCEVYWERRVHRAVPWMRSFADQALSAARDVRLRRYDTTREHVVGRDAGSLTVSIPLDAQRGYGTTQKEMVVYAKDDHRVRFEVRYYSNIPDAINNAAGRNVWRLSSLLRAIRADALGRLPWDRLALTMREAEPLPSYELLPLADKVRAALEAHPGAFRAAMEALLLTGGISESPDGGWASASVLRRLVGEGVLEPIKLVRNQRGTKRYRLAQRYQALLPLFRPPL